MGEKRGEREREELSILMQVLRISIRNRYNTGCANTGSHTLIINDNTAHTDITMSCSCVVC